VSEGAVAVVGMACRYPDARSPAELWENVLAGRRAFRRLPPERLRLADYHSPDRRLPDRIYSTQAALIEGYEFDRVRFRVAGASFRAADPVHWLALDVAAQALADAGFADGEGLPRETTGVVLGNTLTGEFSRANVLRLRWPYVERVVGAELAAAGWAPEAAGEFLARLEGRYKEPFPEVTEESLAGGLANTIAGRIANHFDLRGGGFTVDGACASSLLAVCQGASALVAGDLDVAVVGGVDLSIDPFELVGFAKTGALAADDMRVFDARPTGFIPGEGCGVVVLMREADALAAGRRIYARLRGWGISSDGAGGLTRPEVEGQLAAVTRAYRRAGLPPGDVGLFEGHGTGTAVGDAAELEVLARVRREGRGRRPVPVGSVKANLGHTKAAAGAAALIKAVLALHHQVLPPTTGCEDPHPLLAGDGGDSPPLAVQRRGEPWPEELPLRAGVSAMGFGGINTHVVVEGIARRRRRGLSPAERCLVGSAQDAELLLLAAAGRQELAAQVARLATVAPRLSRAELGDLAAELARGTGAAGRSRAALVAASPRELAAGLATLAGWLEGGVERRFDPRLGVFWGGEAAGHSPRIGLLFPGQASPSYLDGGALARRFESVAELYRRAELPAGGDPSETAVAQPAIVTASLAGLQLLEALGIQGSVAVGHSLGELVALHWAGAVDDEALLRLAKGRGQAMSALGEADGAMASLGVGPEEAADLIGGRDALVTGYNSPRQTVISGAAGAVEEVVRRARERGSEATRLKVSHAFHSPHMAAVVPCIAATLEGEQIQPLSRRVASTVTGGLLPPAADLRQLLVDQLAAPVRFTEAVAAAGEVDLWLEVGPGRVLAGLVAESSRVPVVALDAGGPSLQGLLAAAGAAFAAGVPLAVEALFDGRFTRPFDLDREPVFFVNPCERAPLPGVRAAAAAGAPVAEAAETGIAAGSPAPAAPAVAAAAREARQEPAALPAGAESPLAVLRRLVAARAELPPAAVGEESRLLSDLHLNSIAVGQLVAEAARHVGVAPPASPTDFANATVGAVAEALAEMAESGGGEAADLPPAGVDAWVRPFVVELVERPLAEGPPAAGAVAEPATAVEAPGSAAAGGESTGGWRIVAPPDHPLGAPLAAALTSGRGVALCLPPDPGEEAVSLLLAAARAVAEIPSPAVLLVVQQDGGGGAFARTLQQEMPEVATAVVDLPFDHPRAAAWAAAEARAVQGYAEAHYDDAGCRRVPRLSALPEAAPGGAPPLGGEDVLLVTGGGKGIAAECALALARRSGVRLALLGRSRPEDSPELAANLERFAAAGVVCRYLAADVTDAEAVRRAVAAVEAELGPVTAVLHGAGANRPQVLATLDEGAFRKTLAPKVTGLANVLAAVDPGRLRLLVGFGSIIARAGMRGEADYAVANEGLARAVEAFARRHPHCRCLALEWSVWSGVGMGERLGRVEALLRQGVVPIPPDAGVEAFLGLVAAPPPAVSVVVASRFGEPPALRLAQPDLPFLRFLERPRVYVPGVELVTEAEVSTATDPYLADHVFQGSRLFPAVLGLEAMAQAAQALAEVRGLPIFEQVELRRPVAVSEGGAATLRIAALQRRPGRVEVTLRCAATGFSVDHFRAVCDFGGARGSGDPDLPGAGAPGDSAELPPPLPLSPAADLYGGVLFQGGRFRRLASYRRLGARECLAEISPDGATPWFGRFLPPDLLLGDPGARDAALHGVQACIPHATVLPAGVERLEVGCLGVTEPWFLAARERRREGDVFVYDLEVRGADGRVVERWRGLRLKAVERAALPAAWRPPLLGPYLERRLEELLPGVPLTVAVEEGAAAERRGRSDGALRRLLGLGEGTVRRRPDGRPEVPGDGWVSVAHAGELVLAVAGRGPVGCDLEAVEERSAEGWRDLLGEERSRLAATLVAEAGDDPAAAATRVWAAGECLRKAGALHGSPLVLESATDDGWRLLRSGDLAVGTLVTRVAGAPRPLALAVLVSSAGKHFTHRERLSAGLARRDDRAYSRYAREEQRREDG
jgi:enediyne polyketide synthase